MQRYPKIPAHMQAALPGQWRIFPRRTRPHFYNPLRIRLHFFFNTAGFEEQYNQQADEQIQKKNTICIPFIYN